MRIERPFPFRRVRDRAGGLTLGLLFLFSGSGVFAEKKANWLIKKIDQKFYAIEDSGASWFSFDFKYSGLTRFLEKNKEKCGATSLAPIRVNWKKKNGRAVGYETSMNRCLKEPGVLILREQKDLYLPKGLGASLRGYKTVYEKTKTGYWIKAIPYRQYIHRFHFMKVEIICDFQYRVKKMAFVSRKGANISQVWSLRNFKGKYQPTVITTVTTIGKQEVRRQVRYTYQTKNGYAFPSQVVIKTKQPGQPTTTEEARFLNLEIQ